MEVRIFRAIYESSKFLEVMVVAAKLLPLSRYYTVGK